MWHLSSVNKDHPNQHGATFTEKKWCCGVVVITIAQLHSAKPELSFCTGPNPTCGAWKIRNGEDLWQWPQLEIRLITFCQPTIPQKQINWNAMKRGILLWIWWKMNENWDNNIAIISQQRESHYGINTSVRRKKQIQKSRTVRILVWDPRRKVNHLSCLRYEN